MYIQLKDVYNMKCFIHLILVCITVTAGAQLKIDPNGNLAIGQTQNTVIDTRLRVIGLSAFLKSNSAIQSAPLVVGHNLYSTASDPDYTWYNDGQTGLFHPQRKTIAFAVNGTERMRLNENGSLLMGTADPGSGGEMLVINGGDRRGILLTVDRQIDWWQSMTTRVTRANTVSYVVNWNNKDRFWVMGDGSLYSEKSHYKLSVGDVAQVTSGIEGAADGRKVAQGIVAENRISMQPLPSGLYRLVITSGTTIYTASIWKKEP